MGLVEDDDLGGTAVARRIVKGVPKNFRGRHHDGGVGVDAALAGEQSDGVVAVQPLKAPELLVGKRLERRRVPDAALGAHRVSRRALTQPDDLLLGDPRLAAPGGGGDHHVAAIERLQGGDLERRRHKRNGRGFTHPAEQFCESRLRPGSSHGPEEVPAIPSNQEDAVRPRRIDHAGGMERIR